MKKSGIKYLISALVFSCAFCISASAQVWVFGSSGQGQNPFTAKGYAIKTESGKIQWLYSKFDNGGYDENGNMHMQDGGTVYTGTDNGVQYINAAKADGTTYQLYAFTNRNPLIYNFMFAYQRKSQNGEFAPVSDFTSHLGTPIRTSTNLTEFPNGMNQQWAIPINNFAFEPGTLYEFGFLQGMQANNGISMVLQDDGANHYYGYLMNPYSASEQALYDKMKNVEYQFISSYTKVEGTNYYNVHFVPMRFSVQTYADLTAWNTAAAKAQTFLNGITQSDYASGRYSKTSIDNLKAELASMQNKAQTQVKYQLKTEADKSIADMTNKINADINTAKTETGVFSDMTKLNEELTAANEFYAAAKENIGTQVGSYQKEAVDALKKTIDQASALTKEDLQSDIDKAVTDLENAVINVKSSQIQSDKIILSDFVTGIKVVLERGSIPDNVSLIVSRVDTADQRHKPIADSIGAGVQKLEIYNILLFSGDSKIKPSQPMTIQFPVPDAMKSSDISVYYAGDDFKAGAISSDRTQSVVAAASANIGYFSLVSFGKPITVVQSNTQKKPSTGVNPQSGKGSPSAAAKAANGAIDIIRQTDIQTKEQPDQQQKSLDITTGAGNKAVTSVPDGKSRLQEKVADTEIPKSEVLKGSNPFWLLLLAALSGMAGMVYGGLLIGKSLTKNKSEVR
ncbi:MAG TPA: hypothetical protein VHO66_00020 [Ruminiclostridium sp.]|nr:hypothetical protein [Ruminiclostridium sp.]